MSDRQSLRLAQFWQSTLEPAVDRARESDALSIAALYEAVGWLNLGVFIRYFDRVDADLIWIQMRERIATLTPADGMVMDGQFAQVRALLQMDRPFREVELAPAGESQSVFEARLLPMALLNADRFAADTLASVATAWLWADDDREPEVLAWQFEDVTPDQLASALSARARDVTLDSSANATILAGCVRLLEHMHASNEFFAYAETLSNGMPIDFDSYCDRTGGLNAWRVPVFNDTRIRRFEALTSAVGRIISEAIDADAAAASGTVDDASDATEEFARHVSTLRSQWEAHHLLSTLIH